MFNTQYTINALKLNSHLHHLHIIINLHIVIKSVATLYHYNFILRIEYIMLFIRYLFKSAKIYIIKASLFTI